MKTAICGFNIPYHEMCDIKNLFRKKFKFFQQIWQWKNRVLFRKITQ
jgi:hypothetical protein